MELPLDQAKLYPLAVDLDHTLVRVDILVEQFLGALVRHPLAAIKTLGVLRLNRSSFKSAVMRIAEFEAADLPFNDELLTYLRAETAKGRELHLVTAADQSIADLVSTELGIFKSATGSHDGRNLKGIEKLRFLRGKFPNGFSYAGDDASDVAIWREAKSAILVGVDNSTRSAVAGLECNIELELTPTRGTLVDWIRLLRVHQWSKNFLVFVPLLLGQTFTQWDNVANTCLAFVAMCLAASGGYIVNDIGDLQADRGHATKRRRPVANSRISAASAFGVAAVLVLAAVTIAAWQSAVSLLLILGYLIATFAYSSFLKRIALVDVFALATLYTLRVVLGGVSANAPTSHWLLMFSFFFFFGLSLAKRHTELIEMNAISPTSVIPRRGYKSSDWPLTLSLGIGTTLLSVLVLSLYVAGEMFPKQSYLHPDFLFGIVVVVMMWSSRVWFLSHRGELQGDPVQFALRDPASWIMGAGVLVLLGLSAF